MIEYSLPNNLIKKTYGHVTGVGGAGCGGAGGCALHYRTVAYFAIYIHSYPAFRMRVSVRVR